MRLPRFRRQDPIYAADLNKLAEEIEKQSEMSVLGGRIRNVLGRKTLVIDPVRARGGGGSVPQPFDVGLSGVGDPNEETGEYSSYLGKVRPGVVGGLVPANIFTEFSVAQGALIKWKLRVATNGKAPTSAQIIATAADPDPQTPVREILPSSFDVLFGISKNDTFYRTIGPGSPVVNSSLVLVTTEVGAAGVPVDVRWFAWRY